MDVITSGNGVVLEFSESGMDYLPSPCAATGLEVLSVELTLPIIDRGGEHEAWFDVPPWWEVQEM